MTDLQGFPWLSGRGRMTTMEKWLCWASLGVAGFLLLLFLLDLALSFPFGRLDKGVDIFIILASAVVLLLSWDALRDLQ